MADLIILRLHPPEPMAADAFSELLDQLQITAYDLSFSDSKDGVELGVAKELANPLEPNNQVEVSNTSIMQHYIDVPQRHLESVATAVIVVTPPVGTEYPTASSYDLRLEITRNGMAIAHHKLEYNVGVDKVGALPKNQKTYFAQPASAFVMLPAAGVGQDSAVATVDVPSDGQPPAFDDLCIAIDKVLAKDPGGANADLEHLSPLTAVQSRHIASEIVWNRIGDPPPNLPALGQDPFGAMYTTPPADPSVPTTNDAANQARKKFEAELRGYYGIHDAMTLRLAGFVFSASAAIQAERLSREAIRARLDFPVITGAGTSTTIPHASVVLLEVGDATAPFVVPAAYFYALTANMPAQVGPKQRYDLARFSREPRLLEEFQIAADGFVIKMPAEPFTGSGPALAAAQAARRLHALGSVVDSVIAIVPNTGVTSVVEHWLGHDGPTATIDAGFWELESINNHAAYLDLLLSVITDEHDLLMTAVKGPPLGADTVAKLVALTDERWRSLFLGPGQHTGPYQVALLPAFTLPGSPGDRTEAFIRHLRKFFEVKADPPGIKTPDAGAPPGLGSPVGDAFVVFVQAYIPAPFTFGEPLDIPAVRTAAAQVFPGDAAAQTWLVQAIETIEALNELTTFAPPQEVPELQFSLMEALYARGFTSAASVSALSAEQFALALTGSVAYPFANAIYQRAGGAPATVPQPGPFAPVNPDGLLTDCVPPPHRSPLGAVAYLNELLQVSFASTCADPQQQGPEDAHPLATLLAGRRGPLGGLHATRANLEVPLPVVDLVNESLESLTAGLQAGVSGGAVHDTTGDDKLRAAVPAHSSPAMPGAEPDAYELLRSDFTAPDLPYAQGLDVNRSYLEELGSTRYAAMRRFRKEIAEFAIDAAHEPADFQRHLWRYPARLETALEYLHISPEEYDLLYAHDIVDTPTAGRLLLRELYGFSEDTVEGRPWTEVIVELPEFLRRTGVTYCEFIELWRWGPVAFGQDTRKGQFATCQPCCLDDLVIALGRSPKTALRQLAVFIRLWRRLQTLGEPRLTIAQLRDACDVLHLFDGGKVNPEFVRQLAAMLMLRDLFCLPMTDRADESPRETGAKRTHLLALWVGPGAAQWDWAVTTLLEQFEDMADKLQRGRRGPEWTKVLAGNLDPLSVLAGFDPATPELTWHAQPTSTLRFAEVLWKITLSEFTVGEVLFLFTVDDHLDGDDPFPLQPSNESYDDPFQHPDDQPELGLWGLRRKLLEVTVDDDEAGEWTWSRILAALRDEHGLPHGTAGLDRLIALGEHFFPSVLQRDGHPVDTLARQYRIALPVAATTPAMWNTPPGGPFRYDLASGHLWTQLPLRDRDVAEKLSEIRTLSPAEQDAVRDLYFAPRAALAPFSLVFWNFERAVDELVQEHDEEERFRLLQREFARFERRCHTIADHLAEHVAAATGRQHAGTAGAAWRLLRQLWGDENRGVAPWEDDAGKPPGVTWEPQPTGGAFAALLGLAGTGVVGEFAVHGGDPAWRELRGPLTAFSPDADAWNAPVPTVIPSMGLTLTPAQQRHVVVRNGFAMRDVDGEPLFGAQPFQVRWSGALLVEQAGEYRFQAGAPTADGKSPDFDAAHDKRWLVTLRRGQRRWFVLNQDWPAEEAPAASSEPLLLRRGVYEIEVLLEQPEPTFVREEEICPRHSGFQIKYAGPDSDDIPVAVPFDRLFRPAVDETLDSCIDTCGVAKQFLRDRYTSSLRDIRRTYQRAFKAVLFAHLFELSAKPLEGDPQSELGYMLEHAEQFAGRAYFQTAPDAFGTHLAWFDPNLLPVADPHGPAPAGDERAQPSAKRRAALFDCWERIYDYDVLRRETASARERPAWRLFYEATDLQPDDPAQLLRHLGIDIRHATSVDQGSVPILLTYFDAPAPYTLQIGDLESEPWAVRAWQGEKWLRALEHRFLPRWIGDAEPARWAADDPNASGGNENLTRFVQNGCFENGEPRRYLNIQALDDGLRTRARTALVAYLCGMDRVTLPHKPGHIARNARDLSDLLLQDVEVGVYERASRIEEAISSVHAFVQRARLGLEPSLVVTPAFIRVWDGRFATFNAWECCKQREVYRENWIEWDEVRQARKVEAFRFLEEELRNATLTVAVTGGLAWWPDGRPPAHPCLELLQAREPSHIRLLGPAPDPENLDRMGTPERDATPSWLAPLGNKLQSTGPVSFIGDDKQSQVSLEFTRDDELKPSLTGDDKPHLPSLVVSHKELQRLPLWIQAAVRVGARFVRVAAAGIPPASKPFAVCEDDAACCAACGATHRPLVDEYYFWLIDSRHFDAVVQDADVGLSNAPSSENGAQAAISGWHDGEKLPGLLEWPSKPMVHLAWSRFHNGEFQSPRRSTEGVAIDAEKLVAGTLPQLNFTERKGDSLHFQVSHVAPVIGHADDAPPGFRYDLATDSAVVLPLVGLPVKPPAVKPPEYPGGLRAYPFFAYVCPGAPVEPLSLFSVALTVAGTLRAHCHYEAALKWYELVYNPLRRDDEWALCRRRVPVLEDPPGEDPDEPRDDPPDDPGPPIIVSVAGEHVPSVRATTVDPPRPRRPRGGDGDVACCPHQADDDVARDRALLLHHLETLLQWGDALMCRNSPEAMRQAEVIFDTIGGVLGEHPQTVFAADDHPTPQTLTGFKPRPAPLNPRLMALYERTADRRDLVHHCLNAQRLRNGRPNLDMPYFGDDPRREGWQCRECSCCDCGDCVACCDAYRFTFRLQKALELVGEVRSLGSELLSAYEKRDGEYLASLRASHERQLLELALDIRKNQWRDADWQVQALQKTKEGAQTRLRYYQTLIANGLISGEVAYEALTGVSMASRTAGNVLEAIAQGIGITPDMWLGIAGIFGTPLEFNQLPVGNKLASGFTTAARILNAVADIANTNAGLNLSQSGWERREEEWRHQVEVIGIEIEQIERQILGAERRRDVALRELNNHQRQIEHSIEVQDFLRDKFTNHELYLFLQRETAALYYQTYELAHMAARQAERAFNYERGHTSRSFVPENTWDDLHEGLLAGERLQLGIRRMEKAYLDENCREYELTKHVSLQFHLPLAFAQLRATGSCEIELPEWMFDLDYPGHYMRRIKNLTVSIPAVVGPYTGVHCRLTLLSSTTRVDPRLRRPPAECCGEPCNCDCGNSCCSCDPSPSGYAPVPDDPRVVRAYAATEAIATSSGQNDSGMFELNFRDERYLPFEFAGAVSRWRIDLPPETNYFDFDSLSDVLLHLNYTAREGGETLRAAAAQDARSRLPGDGLRLFDVRRELPDAWNDLRRPAVNAAHNGHGAWDRRLPLRLSKAMFPFVPTRRVRWIDALTILFEAPGAEPSTNHVVRYHPAAHRHDHDADCDCHRTDVHCVASDEYPGLFWGVVDLRGLRLGPIEGDQPTNLGTLAFPDALCEICEVQLVARYCADPWPGCGEPEDPCGCRSELLQGPEPRPDCV